MDTQLPAQLVSFNKDCSHVLLSFVTKVASVKPKMVPCSNFSFPDPAELQFTIVQRYSPISPLEVADFVRTVKIRFSPLSILSNNSDEKHPQHRLILNSLLTSCCFPAPIPAKKIINLDIVCIDVLRHHVKQLRYSV